MRSYISGHKTGLLSPAGLLLTLSLFFSICLHIGVVAFLGHFNIFLVPLPLVVLALVILVVKSCIDEDFQTMPIGQRITYSLLAAIFPISSPRPASAERRRADGVLLVQEKDASSELMLLHLMHLGNWMVWAVVYLVLMQVSPAFEDAMGKVKESSELDSTWVVCLACPVAWLSSILCRVIYNKVQTWILLSSSSQRSCFACCPPKMKSSYREIPLEDIREIPVEEVIETPEEEIIETPEEETRETPEESTREIPAEEIQNAESVAAELGDIFAMIRDKRKNQ